MTNFAGEEYLVTHIALGFDDEPLTNADIPSVVVTIYTVATDEDGEPLPDEALPDVTNQVMEWNASAAWSIRIGNRTITGEGWWQYLWDTKDSGITEGGTWVAKVTLTGVTGGKNVEFLRIRLKTPRTAV